MLGGHHVTPPTSLSTSEIPFSDGIAGGEDKGLSFVRKIYKL